MQRLSRRDVLRGAAAPFLITAARGAKAGRTNVVFFMTDDHGAWASGAYGCRDVHTPRIDALARTGARFPHAFACTPVCSPSRMTYFTGKLPSQHGVQDWLRPEDSFGPKTRRFLDGHLTFSEVLARQGYTLGLSGKWHMGDDEHAQAGFTYWCTVPGGGGTYRDPIFVRNGKQEKIMGFKTDIIGDLALAFLDSHRDRPFFLYVPFYAPHTPYDYVPEEYRHGYAGSAFPCFPDTPTHAWQTEGLAQHHSRRESKLAYAALISGVDANVGRILERLNQHGLRENTLIVFTADQGWNAGHHGVWGKGNGTVPWNLYEESIRVPLIWNQPSRIKQGLEPPTLVSSYDFAATLLDYLGVKGWKGPRFGRSYAAFLRGESPRWRDRLYFEYCYLRGVRTENLKYVQRTGEWPSEMYDLQADPGETRDVIGEPAYAAQGRALRADIEAFFHAQGAPPLEQWKTTTVQKLTQYRRAVIIR
jgi:arylsulfatase A-like enzyme